MRLADSLSPHFTGMVLDGVSRAIEESYRLRYQVYCHERGFLPAANYPDQQEIDKYDRHSTHFGVLNNRGELVATARLVEQSEAGLPMLEHCAIVPADTLLHYPKEGVVEVSRLAVSRNYNRRSGDGFYSLQGPDPDTVTHERRLGGEIVLALYKVLYQASKVRGHTHWLMAMEKSLRRLLTRYGFPFVPIGPESDYYGLVAPYSMNFAEFDAVITSGRIPILAEFREGLEPPTGAPSYRPRRA